MRTILVCNFRNFRKLRISTNFKCFFLFCYSLERFLELNEEALPSTPPPVMDEAMIEDEFGDDDFFAGSELQLD